jgi:prolipoprotein diacylglyceryltransferase
LKFNFYGLILGLTFLGGYFHLRRSRLPARYIDSLLVGTILWGIVGARLYHVFDFWDYYSQNLVQIINLPSGGLGIFGGIIAALIYIYYFCARHRLSFWFVVNLIALYMPLAQSIGRFGNYFNHEIYSSSGRPLWLYESIGNLVLFGLINRFHSKLKFSPFGLYLIGYGFIRLLIDYFRADVFIMANFKISQVFGVIFILVGLWTLKKLPPIAP